AGDGTVVGRGSAPHPGGTETDPAAWWTALAQAGDGLLQRAAAVGVAGQQHGMVVLDAAGEVIRPALLWNDLRSASAAAALIRERGGPLWWATQTGSVPTASFTVTKLRWLPHPAPAPAARGAPGGAGEAAPRRGGVAAGRARAGPRPWRRIGHRVLLARRRPLAARHRRRRPRPPAAAAPDRGTVRDGRRGRGRPRARGGPRA